MERGYVCMISLIREYGFITLTVIGTALAFFLLVYLVMQFGEFADTFISTLTGSGKTV